VIKDFI